MPDPLQRTQVAQAHRNLGTRNPRLPGNQLLQRTSGLSCRRNIDRSPELVDICVRPWLLVQGVLAIASCFDLLAVCLLRFTFV